MYLFAAGSDLRVLMLNQETNDGQTPFLLFAASRYQNGELVGFYAKNGANLSHIDHKVSSRSRAIFIAALY
jgi:hypothetical protein